MNPRPFFANVHIPKCGGTTFRTLLARNFRGRYEEVYNLIWEDPYTAAQIAFFVDDSPGYDCISSHRLSLDLPFEGTRRRVVALAFVRDPVDRLFSHYHYERGRSYRRRRFAYLGEMSPAQYVEHVLGSPSEDYLLAAQYRHLTQNVVDPSLAKVLDLVASGRLLLLPLERFDESLLVLRRSFPGDFTDLRYARQNVSTKDREVDPALRERLRDRLTVDADLHAAANAWLDARLGEHYPERSQFDAELKRLRRRCRRYRRWVAGPTVWAKGAFARLSRMLGA